MYSPHPLEDLLHDADLFWIYLKGQWQMASIIWRGGRPLQVSVAPGAVIDSWEACRLLPAIAVVA
ncbi:hypothetical protein [Beijerinckia sp. L45]|uniref:hypothetical protein n=1 Tax=Beijerinckia sp. L45 TaxID=1641855 RepID=UPI00131BCD1A|nr:hypothetical protein [Beijerinckia sp. L45]